MEYLTVKEAASLTKFSASTIYRWCEGKIPPLPHYKKSRQIRIRFDDLQSWMDRDKIGGNALPARSTFALTMPPVIAIPGAKGGLNRVAKKAARINFGHGKVYPRRTKSGQVRWYLDFKDADGRRIRKVVEHAQSSDDALMVLQKKESDAFLKQNPGLIKKREVSFEEFAKTYLEDYIKVNRRNWKSDEYRLQFLVGHFRGFLLTQITPLRIEEMKSRRLEAGNAKSTINRYLALLKRLFTLAIQEGYCEENPVKKVKFYSEKDSFRERTLTTDEEKRLFEASSERLRPVLVVALNTAMRLGEILGLRWSRIDLRSGTLRVERTKSGKVLTLPMNSVLRKELMGLRKRKSKEDAVFPFKSIRTAFENARERAELSGLTFHALRHTAGSRMIERGVDVITVKEIMGHSSVVVTQRYLHTRQELMRRAVEVLCVDSEDIAEKSEDLAHRWHTIGIPEDLRKFLSSTFSRN